MAHPWPKNLLTLHLIYQQTLRFDLASGGWRLTEQPEDQPKTPERAEILALLKASDEPLSPKQVAEALGKHHSTIGSILPKMARAGEVKTVRYRKYAPIDTVGEDEANPLPAEEEDDLPPDDGGSPWWERSAEPPCFSCGKPAGTGRDQWARPLCMDCLRASKRLLSWATPAQARRFASTEAGDTGSNPWWLTAAPTAESVDLHPL